MPTAKTIAPSAINNRGLQSRAQKRYAEAIAIFRDGIAQYPDEATLHNNLAVTLEETGDSGGALQAYRDALELDPTLWAAQYGAGVQLMRQNAYVEAEPYFRRALEGSPDFIPAHLAIYELAQIRGDRTTALAHQALALQQQFIFSSPSATPKRTVLAVMTPGDWQANIPVDFLFNQRDTTLHKLFLAPHVDVDTVALPEFDVGFNCIAEADDAREALDRCARLIARTRAPFLNAPDAVLNTNREVLPRVLAGTGAQIPHTVRLTRDALLNESAPFEAPYLIRPVGSHAGADLEKIDTAHALSGYLDRVGAPLFYLTKFVDYSSADGYFRKHRIILVDGEPYPFHMAVSDHWMVHYYNSLMAEHAWMRAEEEAFLAGFGAYDAGHQRTLRAIAQALQLDYFGIDCAIARDGSLLVFEADPGVIVHIGDSKELYPYKQTYVPRIFRAVEAMIDKHARPD